MYNIQSLVYKNYLLLQKAILRDTIIDINMTVSKAYSFTVIFILGLSIADNVHLPGEEVIKIGKNFLNASILFWLSLVQLVIRQF